MTKDYDVWTFKPHLKHVKEHWLFSLQPLNLFFVSPIDVSGVERALMKYIF